MNKYFWFKEFRKNELLQFAGDAALYISRSVGSEVVAKLREDDMSPIAASARWVNKLRRARRPHHKMENLFLASPLPECDRSLDSLTFRI